MNLSVLSKVSETPIINSRRVPCKARGMGADHKYDNAYFVIGGTIPHGKLIECSHHACVQSGRKFLYCAVCQLPCAKRNFSRRHSHGSLFQQTLQYDQCVPIDTPCQGPKEKQSAKESCSKIHAYNSISICSPFEESGAFLDSQELQTQPTKVCGSMTIDMGDTRTTQLTPMEITWLSILLQRPKTEDTDAMTSWLSNVIDVSEYIRNQQLVFDVHRIGSLTNSTK